MWRAPLAATLLLLGTGCASGVAVDKALEAACQRTAASRSAHAGALAEDGGIKSILSGERLLKELDAACEPHDKGR